MQVNVLICGSQKTSDLFRRALSEIGVSSSSCPDVPSALATLKGRKYAAIVVDTCEMSGGVDLLTSLRDRPAARKAIVMAVAPACDSASSFQKGANFVFEHPLTYARIVRGLRAAHGLMLREQDRYHRLPVDLSAKIAVRGTIADAAVLNVSEGGMAIQLPSQLQSGVALEWSLNLPGEPASVDGTGHVMWSEKNGTAGVMFARVGAQKKDSLSRWLRATRPSRYL